MSHINMRKVWVTQLTDSYEKWISTTTVSKPLPHSMLTLNDWHQVHLDFVTATDFLGAIFSTYEDLILPDPVNHTIHLTNYDKDLDKVRKCFKRLKTYIISDNYFRSISGLPLHHTQNINLVRQHLNKIVLIILSCLQILKLILYWKPWYNLTCMSMETPCQVGWYMEHPWQMDLRRVCPHKKKTTPLQDLGPSPSLHLRTKYKGHFRLYTPMAWHYQKTQATLGWTIHRLTPVNIVDPAPAVSKVTIVNTPCVQQSVTPVSFASQSILLWTQSYLQFQWLWYPFHKSQAWLVQLTPFLPHKPGPKYWPLWEMWEEQSLIGQLSQKSDVQEMQK